MDEAQAKQFLGISGSGTAPAPTNSTTPQTDIALQSAISPNPTAVAGREGTAFLKRQADEFQAANAEPGVPFDAQAGASSWDRMMLSFRRDRQNEVAHLQSKYGKDNVRLSSDGGLIVRVADSETGKPKDLLVDEQNMSAKDFIDVIGTVPEIAAGIYAMRKGQAAPWMKNMSGFKGVVRDATTSAVGAEGAGFVKDVGANLIDRGTLDIGKTAGERGKMAAVDLGVGVASFPIARFMKLMENPLAPSRGRVQFEAIEAQNYFKEKYGVEVPLSIGESTGSPFASRTEVFLEKMPGASTPFSELKGKQETALRKLQSLMMGTVPESDEVVGNKLIAALQDKMAPLETGVESARAGVATSAGSQIEKTLAGLTMPERQLYKTQVGKEVRAGVVAKRDAVKTEADRLYEAARALPGGTGKEFSGQGLQADFKRILDNLPAPESTTQVPTGLLGPTGQPILRSSTGKELLKEFVPPNILSRLRSVTELKGAKFSLSDLQQMRREVYDDIAKGEGVPGIGTHYLADIGKSLTKAIDDGVTALPTGELKTALQAANTHYKEKVIPFNRLGITELFRNADEAGHLADDQIISRVLGGDRAAENFKLMKETLGDASPEFVKLKRAVADNLIESSRLPGDEMIDAQSLIRKLSKFRTEHREIADDVFGKDINAFFKEARMLDFTQGNKDAFVTGGPSSQGDLATRVSADELRQLLSGKSPTVAKLQELVNAEAARNAAYKTKILKEVQTGKLSGDLNPEEFVNRFVDLSTSSDVSKVMAMIKDNPELTGDIRAKIIEKLFRDAARKATPQDISKLMGGDPTRIVSGTAVFKEIEKPSVRKKMESILGKETWEDLQHYIKLEATTEAKETSFKSAGGIAAGMQVANLVRNGPLQYLSGATKDFVVANLLTRQPLRGWLTSVPSKEPGMVYMLLSNPSFLQAVTKEFGEGTGAEMFVNAVKQSVDRWTAEEVDRTSGRQAEAKQASERERMKTFLQSGQPSLTGVPAN